MSMTEPIDSAQPSPKRSWRRRFAALWRWSVTHPAAAIIALAALLSAVDNIVASVNGTTSVVRSSYTAARIWFLDPRATGRLDGCGETRDRTVLKLTVTNEGKIPLDLHRPTHLNIMSPKHEPRYHSYFDTIKVEADAKPLAFPYRLNVNQQLPMIISSSDNLYPEEECLVSAAFDVSKPEQAQLIPGVHKGKCSCLG